MNITQEVSTESAGRAGKCLTDVWPVRADPVRRDGERGGIESSAGTRAAVRAYWEGAADNVTAVYRIGSSLGANFAT